jgi:ribosome biogenesis GTPase
MAAHPVLRQAPGVVIRSVGSSYRVRMQDAAGNDGTLVEATLRGKFRLDESRATNPIAVGDRVEVEFGDESASIVHLYPRHNAIYRRATKSTSLEQVLCANVDQGVFVGTLAFPFTPLGYIDRFLVMCEAYHIPGVLVFNKIDLVADEAAEAKLDDYVYIYRGAGYLVLTGSALDPAFKGTVVELLKDKISFLAGPSGAGKSSLINLADPTLHLKTSTVSVHSEKGRHTTTFAEMHPLSFGGAVIDAPGFREFDIVGIERAELAHFFPEMQRLMSGCKFNNCTHTSEPGCAVVAALETGEVQHTRYHTYTSMLEGIVSEHKG